MRLPRNISLFVISSSLSANGRSHRTGRPSLNKGHARCSTTATLFWTCYLKQHLFLHAGRLQCPRQRSTAYLRYGKRSKDDPPSHFFLSLDPTTDVLGYKLHLPHDFSSPTPIHSSFTSSLLPAGSAVRSSPFAFHPPVLVPAGGFPLPLWHTAVKKEPKSQKLTMSEVQSCLKKGLEQENRRFWWCFRGCYCKKVDFPKSPV